MGAVRFRPEKRVVLPLARLHRRGRGWFRCLVVSCEMVVVAYFVVFWVGWGIGWAGEGCVYGFLSVVPGGWWCCGVLVLGRSAGGCLGVLRGLCGGGIWGFGVFLFWWWREVLLG